MDSTETAMELGATRSPRLGWIVAAVTGLALLGQCTQNAGDVSRSQPAVEATIQAPAILDSTPTGIASAMESPSARTTFKGLRVSDRRPVDPTYRRAAFGSGWVDIDRNGCNQRDDVLLRDAVAGTIRVQRRGGCSHDVVSGTWIDPYTGKRIALNNLKNPRQAQAIQIDHLVALHEAWISGADAWHETRRVAFANALDELAAVDGPTNASKSDGDPAAWRPKKRFQCGYARRWIAVKRRWELVADPSEVAALRQMLAYCPT